MTPKELIDTIINSGEYGEDEIEFAKSVNVQLHSTGITKKQWNALAAIVTEQEAAKAGWTPYDPEHAYRVGL
jgi:hypothetical protein